MSRRWYAPKNTQQVGLFRPRRAGACPRRRYGFAGMRRSSLPRTARRHTQVPPYIPGRSANMVRRAGPMCPAAGTHQKTHNRLVCSDHVGRGLAPAAGTGSPECAGHRYPAPPGGTRRCRPTSPDGVPIWSVGRDLCVPPLVRTKKTHNRLVCSDHVGRGLAPAAGTGSPECAGHRYPAPPGGTRRCRPTSPDGVPIWSVGRDLCVPPPGCTENLLTGWFVPAALCDMVFKY